MFKMNNKDTSVVLMSLLSTLNILDDNDSNKILLGKQFFIG